MNLALTATHSLTANAEVQSYENPINSEKNVIKYLRYLKNSFFR
jgi:hypothetical protein